MNKYEVDINNNKKRVFNLKEKFISIYHFEHYYIDDDYYYHKRLRYYLCYY